MDMMNENNAEIRVKIEGDLTDVYLNGNTSNLVIAICAVIRSIAINLADNMDTDEIKEILDVDEIPREELQELFVPHILAHIIDGLDDISMLIKGESDKAESSPTVESILTEWADILKRNNDNDESESDGEKSILNFDIFDNENIDDDDEDEDGEDNE